MSSPVRYESADGVARITLDSPDRGNPINTKSVTALLECVRRARADDVHVVVLAAVGRMFSVGGDLDAFRAAANRGELIDDLADAFHRVITDLHQLNAIVVSVVHGTAAGAGLSLAAAADLVMAAESAKFTLAYTNVGLSPDGGSTLLPASIGLHRALALTLLNPVLTASEAHRMGLVAEVHPDADLAPAVERVVRQIRAGSRDAQAASKRLLREVATPAEDRALRREVLSIRARAASADGAEGVAAFAERRSPEFPGNPGA